MSSSPVAEREAAELVRLADALVDEIAAARRRNAELRDVIDAAAGARSPADDAPPVQAEEPMTEEPVAEEESPTAVAPIAAAPTPAPRAAAELPHEPDAEDEAEAAHLAAVSMALTGTTREGAREQLRETFGLENPDALIDETFGPEPKRRFVRLRRGGR